MCIRDRKKGISKNNNKVKVKHYSSATINDVHKKLNDITSHKPDVVILHLRTNDAPNKTSNAIVDNILSLKHAVEKALPYCKVILSSLTPRLDNGKANLTIKHFNDHLKQKKIKVMDNTNITSNDLGKKRITPIKER